MSEVLGEVKAFILSNFVFDQTVVVGEDDSFLEKGIVDSTGILEVVAWIEETYGFKVADQDLLPENFDSLRSLSSYISRKAAA